jgi:ABC-type dipeptide/oligopeptide/nickel transport system ATPase component
MVQGVVIEHGSAIEVMDQPRQAYTKTLLAAVPDVGRALKP